MTENINVHELEQMAKFTLTEAEADEIKKYMEFILKDFEEKLPPDENIAESDPLIHGVELANVLREDRAVKTISREALLRNAPDSADGYFKVPMTLE